MHYAGTHDQTQAKRQNHGRDNHGPSRNTKGNNPLRGMNYAQGRHAVGVNTQPTFAEQEARLRPTPQNEDKRRLQCPAPKLTDSKEKHKEFQQCTEERDAAWEQEQEQQELEEEQRQLDEESVIHLEPTTINACDRGPAHDSKIQAAGKELIDSWAGAARAGVLIYLSYHEAKLEDAVPTLGDRFATAILSCLPKPLKILVAVGDTFLDAQDVKPENLKHHIIQKTTDIIGDAKMKSYKYIEEHAKNLVDTACNDGMVFEASNSKYHKYWTESPHKLPTLDDNHHTQTVATNLLAEYYHLKHEAHCEDSKGYGFCKEKYVKNKDYWRKDAQRALGYRKDGYRDEAEHQYGW